LKLDSAATTRHTSIDDAPQVNSRLYRADHCELAGYRGRGDAGASRPGGNFDR
jgi:hypothetical protein